MSSRLRDEFIKLLEEDKEFRYAVAGYLGLSETLKRLDSIEETIRKIWAEIHRVWENIEKLWEEVRAIRQEQEKLRIEQEKMRQEQEKSRLEQAGIREEQERMRQEQERLRLEQVGMRLEIEKLRQEQEKLRLEQVNMRHEIEKLRLEQERLRKYMVTGFTELRNTLGVTFETHAAAYIQMLLMELGYPQARVERRHFVKDGEVVDVDIFCEDPLVVGEVTVAIRDVGGAESEVEKLMERAELVSARYGRKPFMVVLSAARVSLEAAERLREMSEALGFRLVLGSEIEELAS
ncbi:MAG: hypothetical protein RMJ28_04255 [Nitrososphaerota archaeon]|nr:hypothetical protein [Candidatus Calditenuaceae archaeon]MDW8073433.1 hypothetical protein [Nitrososphaerota archaeon]